MTPTTSLLDRANLDRDSVRHQIARGLEGADDGELFLEYSQSEALMFDNGRLKQATYDTAQGFGLRAVKDDAVGYAHSSDVSLPALIRAADAVHAVRGGYSGNFAAAPAHTAPSTRKSRGSPWRPRSTPCSRTNLRTTGDSTSLRASLVWPSATGPGGELTAGWPTSAAGA